MRRAVLSLAIVAAISAGCASKTQNTTQISQPTPAAASIALTTAPTAIVSAVSPPAPTPGGSLAFPASGLGATATPTAAGSPAVPNAGSAGPAAGASTATPASQPANNSGPASTPVAAPSSGGQSPAPAASAAGKPAVTAAPDGGSAPAGGQDSAVASTPRPVPLDPAAVIELVKLDASDLPAGLGIGGLAGYQTIQAAVNGYDNPPAVMELMARTGRGGGYIEQITTAESSNGAGMSIEVWLDAAGAKTYFDSYPRPEAGFQYEQIDVPGLGDQVFAYRYHSNGRTGYAISWRRGRIVMGVGESLDPANDSIDHVMTIVNLLDKKAQTVPQ